jgi:hypothetical protein
VPGYPIRTPSDLSSVDSSPRLIAASYVLHRLLMPRHPPCALNNLTTKMLASTVQFSNNHPNQPPTRTPDHTHTGLRYATRQSGGTKKTPSPARRQKSGYSLRTQQCANRTIHNTRHSRFPRDQAQYSRHHASQTTPSASSSTLMSNQPPAHSASASPCSLERR